MYICNKNYTLTDNSNVLKLLFIIIAILQTKTNKTMTLTETIKQTEQMNKQDFQTLFFHMLQTAKTKYNMTFLLNDLMTGKNSLLKYDFENENEKTNRKDRVFGMLKGKIKISDDFDEPLECFNDYMY